jgi:tetratricopeptide (TPR) repeat protein
MRSWRFWRLVILVAVLGGLVWTLLYRSPIGRLGTVAATIQTPYQTEHDWAIRATAADIDSMAAFASGRQSTTSAPALPSSPWDVDGFAAAAVTAFGEPSGEPNNATFQADLFPQLTALDARALVDAGTAASAALSSNMRDPRAHEAAALVVGAFALRDAADRFTDVRWALNRMTAHLAAARALRRGAAAGPDGAIASVIHATLSNQQARASTELAALGAGTPPEPLNAWIRALRMRIEQDWRVLPDPPGATRLEKLEYFRARRAAVRRRRAVVDLAAVNESMAADFSRLAQDQGVGLEDGYEFVLPAVELELNEARQAYQLVHGRPMPASLAEALNHRAPGLIESKPVVLPWGAWAEFFQRHLAMNVGMVDSFYRYYRGDTEGSDASKAALDAQLGELTLFPVGTARRTKGPGAAEADLAYLPRVVALAQTAPELIAASAWTFFELGSRYEPVARSMPPMKDWFTTPTAAVPFESGMRMTVGAGPSQKADAEALISVAPTDTLLLVAAARGGSARARELLRARAAFDLRAVDALLIDVKDDTARADLQKLACDISSRDCVALASTLIRIGREDDAAREFERAFADPTMDAVALAADSGWLVDYYRRRLRIDDAMALAERSASVGSAAGLATRGKLRERTGDHDGAEEDFLQIAGQYNSREYLLGFYYRRVEVAHDERYRGKWTKWLAETFPKGLQPEPTSMPAKPETGVFINQDSERSRQAGIRAGDIVVGLEGWRVETEQQYRAINEFFVHPTVKLTLWRGTLVHIEADSPNRLFGTELRTYPLKGWIQ